MLDEFVIKGPNGEHQCVVTAPASMSLSDAREASDTRLFQLPVARAVAAQLIQVVAFLHSRGIVHSDIHLGNILLHFSKSIDNFYPTSSTHNTVGRIARLLCATTFEGFALTPDWMTKEHVTVLGRLLPEWWEKWDAHLQWFNEDGTRNHWELGSPWAERFEKFVQKPRRECGMEEVGNEEKAALFTMLKTMLVFIPGERLTAEEALEAQWMKEWALPELERMRKMR
ncbi:hypothetical protein AJ80_02689 [Polytolypa hystricis UAMH7299]|uniref:Protein kinase domain-containing protein n=1 Tax=Polytolypa hystricis (strain UAMH7299) TaxID=1447883 RepID=A0A2B7YQL2_POLH7|nr:hypothetical protein AJ80_02689 [Polytolypa hystricis UAMH7299]